MNDSPTIDRRTDTQFQHEIQSLLQEAEDMRLKYMNNYRLYGWVAGTIGLLAIVGGASGFGWFLLVKANIAKAIGAMVLAGAIPLLLHLWQNMPLTAYRERYKREYLPQLAKMVGGFAYAPKRGINHAIARKTGVLPPHQRYEAEDCFSGRYKNMRVILSEARLFAEKRGGEPVFNGIFVLLELPHAVFDSHVILTNDRDMTDRYASTRWQKLQPVDLAKDQAFMAYSNKPDMAADFIGEPLLKELKEADAIFGGDGITTVFLRGKYIFLMIPHTDNMFEPSDLFVPISTKHNMVRCKKEIDQLLEIIDIFDLYAKMEVASYPDTQSDFIIADKD